MRRSTWAIPYAECERLAHKVINAYGVSVMDENGEWRSVHDVLRELASVWNKGDIADMVDAEICGADTTDDKDFDTSDFIKWFETMEVVG